MPSTPASAMDSSYQNSPYVSMKKLGAGTFGQVYRGRHRETRKLVALKVIDWKAKKRLPPEVSLLRKLKHDNIVNLVSYERNTEENKLRLALEYMPTDLERYITRKRVEGGMPLRAVKSFMHQLLSGVEFCHRNKILHRDLKPANLLVRGTSQLKIADFGSAMSLRYRRKPLDSEHYYVTLWYRAPELLLRATTYGMAVDIWSVGCIMAEMVSGRVLFQGSSHADQLQCIFRVLGTPTEEDWPGLSGFRRYDPDWEMHEPQRLGGILPRIDLLGLDLLRRMLRLRPEDRISAAEALAHPWFLGVKKGRKGQE